MARRDYLTGKGAMTGNKRSHALNATKRKFNLNLQRVKLFIDGRWQTVKISAKTARTLKKER